MPNAPSYGSHDPGAPDPNRPPAPGATWGIVGGAGSGMPSYGWTLPGHTANEPPVIVGGRGTGMPVYGPAGSPDHSGQTPQITGGAGTGMPTYGFPDAPKVAPQLEPGRTGWEALAPAAAAERARQKHEADLRAGMAYANANKPPEAPPDPAMPQPNHDYLKAFNDSIAVQRRGIDNALMAAMTSLGARRDAAAKVVAGVPQQVKDSYRSAETKGSAVMTAATKASGRTAIGGDENAKLYEADLTSNRNAGHAVQPLLAAGVQANYDLGEAGLNAQHLAGMSQLDSQQAQFNAQMAGQQESRNYQLEDRQYAADHPTQGDNFYAHELFKSRLNPNNIDPKTGLTPDQSARLGLAAEEQAKKAGFTSIAGQKQGAIRGQALVNAMESDAWNNLGDTGRKNTANVGARDPDVRNWLKGQGLMVDSKGNLVQIGS